jgi:hypothetical protein
MFGRQWLDVVGIVKYLSIFFMMRTFYPFFQGYFLSLGLEMHLLFRELIYIFTVMPAIYFGYQLNGIVGVSQAIIISALIDILYISFILYYICQFEFKIYIKNVAKNIVVTSGCFIFVFLIDLFQPMMGNENYLMLFFIFILVFIVWSLLMFFTKNPLFRLVFSIK